MAWAADPKLYPVINPDSGGATGGSLLGSTLGIVVLFLGFPWIAGLPLKRRSRMLVVAWVLLALHYGWFMALDHGHRSHHEASQIIALFSLVLWWPILIHYMSHFTWPEGSRRWLLAFAVWGVILLATALLTFLPGELLVAAGVVIAAGLLVGHRSRTRQTGPTSLMALIALIVYAWHGEPATSADPVARGREVYRQEACITCHSQYVRPPPRARGNQPPAGTKFRQSSGPPRPSPMNSPSTGSVTPASSCAGPARPSCSTPTPACAAP